MNLLLAGGIAMGSIVIALVFLRFWRSSGDRFFLFFSLSFAIEGLHRVYASLDLRGDESSPLHYLVRLLAYGLILFAIWDKNRPHPKSGQ